MKVETIDAIESGIEDYATPAIITTIKNLTLGAGFTAVVGTSINPLLAKILKYFLGVAFDKFIIPAIQFGERKGLLIIDRKRGAIVLAKMNDAENEGNNAEFDSAFDSL